MVQAHTRVLDTERCLRTPADLQMMMAKVVSTNDRSVRESLSFEVLAEFRVFSALRFLPLSIAARGNVVFYSSDRRLARDVLLDLDSFDFYYFYLT